MNYQNRTKLVRTLLLTAALLVPGITLGAPPTSGLKTAKPGSVGMSTARLARVDAMMQRYIDDELIAGSVTLVARRGKVVHLSALGLADVEANRTMTPDTIFRIASMTKPITSVALMMLYEEGHFQLNDPISNWLPEFADVKVLEENEGTDGGAPTRLVPPRHPISVKHVLTHTAGLMSSYRDGHLNVYSDRPRLEPGSNLEASIKMMAKLPLGYHPGERWEYSSATNVVARLVEVMSGMTFDQYLANMIFAPLGMTDTHFYLPVEKLPRFASQYKPGDDNNKIVLQDAASVESRFVKEPHTMFSGSGGLMSTAADYVRFQQMMLNGGELDGVRILGRKTVELMFSNHTGDLPIWLRGPGFGFGLGYSVVLDRGTGSTSQSEGSVSWGGAYNTVFWVDPEEELIGIMMSQLRPYTHVNIRADFVSVVNQAIVD